MTLGDRAEKWAEGLNGVLHELTMELLEAERIRLPLWRITQLNEALEAGKIFAMKLRGLNDYPTAEEELE